MKRNRSQPCLVIPVETKVRELHAKFYMACVAAERGFRVILGGSNWLRHRVAWLPWGAFFLDKSVAPTRAAMFRSYRNLGLRIVAWCEEGLAFIDPDEYLRRKVDREALAQTECFFAWGPYQADLIRRHAPESAPRLVEAGNPRVDLLSPALRDVFYAEAARLRGGDPGLILVNTNFSLCNHKEGEGAFLAGLKAAGKIQVPEDERFVHGWVDHKRALFNAFVEMVPALSERFPDQTIVIRPHPSENHDTWKELTKPLPNVKVVHEGNVIPWLMAARAVVHNGCTTGLEGHLLGRPVVAYQPVTSEVYDTHLPNRVSVSVATLPGLLAAVSRAIEEEEAVPPTEEARRVVQTYLHRVDGRDSDDMVEHLWTRWAAPPARSAVDALLCRLRRGIWRLRMTGRADYVPEPYQLQKFPGLEESELKHLLDEFRRVTGRFDGLVVKQKWPGCFVLQPDPDRVERKSRE